MLPMMAAGETRLLLFEFNSLSSFFQMLKNCNFSGLSSILFAIKIDDVEFNISKQVENPVFIQFFCKHQKVFHELYKDN